MGRKITEVTIKDYSPQVLEAFEKQVNLALNAVGQTAEGYAKQETPVDTGRLRNSITYATATTQSKSADDSRQKATPEEHTVYIGTNVEYAPAVEYRDIAHKTGKAHFIKDAATTHSDEYKAIVKAALQN